MPIPERTVDERRDRLKGIVAVAAYAFVSVGGLVAFLVFTDGWVRWAGATVMAFFAAQLVELLAIPFEAVGRRRRSRSSSERRR
jgi:cytochrome c biogenesis protein CcdA